MNVEIYVVIDVKKIEDKVIEEMYVLMNVKKMYNYIFNFLLLTHYINSPRFFFVFIALECLCWSANFV